MYLKKDFLWKIEYLLKDIKYIIKDSKLQKLKKELIDILKRKKNKNNFLFNFHDFKFKQQEIQEKAYIQEENNNNKTLDVLMKQ